MGSPPASDFSRIQQNIATEISSRASGASGHGTCAAVVRQAVEAATGQTMVRPSSTSAKDYGPSFQGIGFVTLPEGTSPQAGDVRIYDAIPGHPHGHVQVFTDNGWKSDFNQRDEFPGQSYRDQPEHQFTQYRYGGM